MKEIRNEAGFSMIELIVVVAVMAILGAVIVPQFSTISTRARLTTDAASIKVIQQQIDIYKADVGTIPGTLNVNGDINEGGVLKDLLANGYLDTKYLIDSKLPLQTTPSACKFSGELNHFVLVVDASTYEMLKINDANKDTWIIKDGEKDVSLSVK